MDGLSRRRLLAATGASLGAGLAGCNMPTNGTGSSAENCEDELSGAISGEKTLECKRYRVTGDVRVESGGTLTVVPGVTLSFASGTGLRVAPGGSLIAEGTADQAITFTGQDGGRGTWRGIEYEAPSDGVGDLQLSHAAIEGAGSGSTVGEPAGLTVASTAESATVVISNVLVRQNGGHGVWFGDGVRLDTFDANRITANAAEPVACAAVSVTDLGAKNELSGNDADGIAVRGGTIEGDHAWSSFSVPYRLRESLTVPGKLSVEAGSTLAFAQAEGIHVVSGGALTAAGSADAPVTFTGTRKEPGHWAGLWFENTGREENRLDHAVVEYGGGIPAPFAEAPANLVAGESTEEASARVAVTNSVLRHSSTAGFHFGERTTVAEFSKNELTQNGTHPGEVHLANAGAIAANSTFSGNRESPVAIVGGTLPEEAATTLRAIDVGYVVESTPTVEGTLGAEPGTSVQFAKGTGLEATGGGTLKLTGSEDDQVRLLGAVDDPGYWNGIRVVDGAAATLQRAQIAHGGGSAPEFAPVGANVVLGTTDDEADAPTLSIQDSRVRASGANGIHLEDGTKLSKMAGNLVVDNEGAPVSVHASLLSSLDPETTYEGNGTEAVELRGGTGVLVEEDEEFTLRNNGIGYRFFGETRVRGHLDVDPGTVLEFGNDASLRILGGGELTAVGDGVENKVFFRGAEAKSGYWRGIQVDDSTATIEDAEILYGGGGERPFPNAAFRAAVAVTTSDYQQRATLSLTNVRVSHCPEYAFYIGHFTTVEPEDVHVGLASDTHNAESIDHEPHPIGRYDRQHDEDT